MTLKKYVLIILFVTTGSFTFGQSILNNLVINNTTSKKIFVTQTNYYADTTKTNTFDLIGAYSKVSSSSTVYKYFIRFDIFALDSSYSDTLFSRTINLVNLDTTGLTIDIVLNQKSHLPTLYPIDRLKIHADNRNLIFKHNDKIEVKTSEDLTVKGLIKSYNDSSLTIVSGNRNSTIHFDKLNYIKLCVSRIPISATLSLFSKCSFYRIDNSLTKTVRQKQVSNSNGYIGWDWR
jgi:hypothetical protein